MCGTTALILIGKNVRHKFVEDNTDVWYNGRVVSQVGLG